MRLPPPPPESAPVKAEGVVPKVPGDQSKSDPKSVGFGTMFYWAVGLFIFLNGLASVLDGNQHGWWAIGIVTARFMYLLVVEK
ncbi:MAG: hypothetical protein KDA69_13280 [Planctomycetaceae bacterium]|nr:hypothetical protein [Planctomycetaceae bacterium]